MKQSAVIFDVGDADFEPQILARSYEHPVVVDFWAEWCGPCRMLGPLLERLVEERQGAVLLARVNVDQAQGLATEFNISSIPAVKAIKDGKVVLEFVGLLPEPHLREFLDRIVPSEAEKLAQQAAGQTDPAMAEKLYRRVLELDRNYPKALGGLAELLIQRGLDTEAGQLLDRLVPGGEMAAEADRLRGQMALRNLAREYGDEATLRRRLQAEPDNAESHYQLGCVLAGSGRYQDALDELLAAARNDKKLAGSKVKETMVQIFHAIGTRSELADAYRDKLTRLLY